MKTIHYITCVSVGTIEKPSTPLLYRTSIKSLYKLKYCTNKYDWYMEITTNSQFALCAPGGSKSSVSFSISQDTDKAREELFVLEYARCSTVIIVQCELKWESGKERDSRDFAFQQDSVQLHWNIQICLCLNDELPHRWIGLVCDDDFAMFPWLYRSPDLRPCNLFPFGTH